MGRAKCDKRACRSNTRTLRAQPTQHRSERNAPTWGPSQSPRYPQRLSASNHGKTKDNLRPPLMCGVNQWIGGSRRTVTQRTAATTGEWRVTHHSPSAILRSHLCSTSGKLGLRVLLLLAEAMRREHAALSLLSACLREHRRLRKFLPRERYAHAAPFGSDSSGSLAIFAAIRHDARR